MEIQTTTCDGSTDLFVQHFNSFNTGEDIDALGDLGGAEDGDGDGIHSTVQEGVKQTTADGIVHLWGKGIHRLEDLGMDSNLDVDIVDSVTIRGGRESDVIISDDCDGGSTAFDIDIDGVEVVVLENLTIRGFATAINASGSTGGTLILRNCTLIDNTTAGIVAQEDMVVRLENTKIINSGAALSGPIGLWAVNCSFERNDTGLSAENADLWMLKNTKILENGSSITISNPGAGEAFVTVVDCDIVENGDEGINLNAALVVLNVVDTQITNNIGTGIQLQGHSGSVFNVSRSTILGNTIDGINVDNSSSACAAATTMFRGMVSDSQIVANGGDGIEIDVGSGTCSLPTPFKTAVSVGILRNTIGNNVGRGLFETTADTAVFDCEVGHNAIFGNVSGAEGNTGTVCTGAGSTGNQLP